MSIAQSVAVSMAVKNGYGGHLTTLSDSNVDSIMKVCLECTGLQVYVSNS
jgi:hypothetical protein